MRKVIDAVANTDFTLDVTFDDKSVRRFDMKPYLEYPVFRSLRNIDEFRNITVAFGTVQWADGQDISPDTIFIESTQIGDKVIV